jgi:hypothetical protein
METKLGNHAVTVPRCCNADNYFLLMLPEPALYMMKRDKAQAFKALSLQPGVNFISKCIALFGDQRRSYDYWMDQAACLTVKYSTICAMRYGRHSGVLL